MRPDIIESEFFLASQSIRSELEDLRLQLSPVISPRESLEVLTSQEKPTSPVLNEMYDILNLVKSLREIVRI